MEINIQIHKKNQLNFSSLTGDKYTIIFRGQILTATYEQILKECYWKSRSRSINKVIFDLRNVKFFDIFELGLLVLWILDLKKKKKFIEVLLPPQQTRAFHFLERYSFEKLLKENNISYLKKVGKIEGPFSDFSAEFLPLTFAFENKFKEYIEGLPDLDLIEDFEIVKSGFYRDIIINELADNIKKHANDRLPYIVSTKFLMKESEREKENFIRMIKARAFQQVEWERSFFYNLLLLPNRSFLELIIGDGGPGIPKILGKIESCRGKKEIEIIDYAFEYDSTSNPELRWEPIKKWISEKIEDYKNFPHATGLYWLKEIVRKYNGFLSVRSGRTILCYDFLSYPTHGRPDDKLISNRTWELNTKNKQLRNLAYFFGTQYKIYLPISSPRIEIKKSIELKEYDHFLFTVERISLKDYFLKSKSLDDRYKSLRIFLTIIGEKIINLKKKKKKQKCIFLVDFCEIDQIKLLGKVLHYLILELMRRQEPNVIIVAINVDENVISEMKILTEKIIEFRHIKEKVLLSFDVHLNLEVIGISEDKKEILKSLLQRPIRVEQLPKNMEKFVLDNSHILGCKEESYFLNFPYKNIVNALRADLKKEIKSFVLDEESKIFRSKEKFNVHDRYFVEGFFELDKLTDIIQYKEKIQKWVEWELRVKKYSVVITAGRSCQKFLTSLNIPGIRRINIDDPLGALPYNKLITLNKNVTICFITDIIITGESICKILNMLSGYKVLKILTIIDARNSVNYNIRDNEFNYGGVAYPLESIIRYPLNYYKEGKPGHWSYESIKSFHPSSYTVLVRPIALPEESLWQKIQKREFQLRNDLVQDFKNPFLDRIVVSTDSVINGHFITKSNKHMSYFFMVDRIAQVYSDEIADVIKKHIIEIKEKKQGKLKITHILYPKYNPGVDIIVNKISNLLGKSKLVPIEYYEINNILSERDWEFEEVQGMLIFDDSTSSGFTIMRLVDIAHKSNAKFIFAYALMNRASHFKSHFLSNIAAYGIMDSHSELRIKYLADIQIPLYEPSICPLCKYNEYLILLKQEMDKLKFENRRCKEFINDELDKVKITSIKSLQSSGNINEFLSISKEKRIEKCNFRWKLEVAKKEMGARNELKRIVERYKKNPNYVLEFFEVIYDEILYFFEIQKESYRFVFYVSLKNVISEACLYLSKNPEILLKNLGQIILVWYFINDEDFFSHIENLLLSIIINNKDSLWKAISYILIAEKMSKDKNLDKLIDILTVITYSGNPHIDPEVQCSLREIIEYLQRKAEKLNLPLVYKQYTKAILGPYIFDKNYADIIKYIKRKNLNKAMHIFKSWNKIIKNNLQGVDFLLRSNLFDENVKDQIEIYCASLEKIIIELETYHLTDKLGQIEILKKVENFNINLRNIKRKLDVFRCDIKENVLWVLEKDTEVKSIIENLDVKVKKDFREGAEYVFIKEEVLRRVLNELLTNIRHAFPFFRHEENNLRILARTTQTEEFVSLEVLDSGKENFVRKYRRGHYLIKNLIEPYGAIFHPLIRIKHTDESWREGYKKKSIIYFVNLAKPQDIV